MNPRLDRAALRVAWSLVALSLGFVLASILLRPAWAATSNPASAPASYSYGAPVIEWADARNGGLAVSVIGGGDPITFPDGGLPVTQGTIPWQVAGLDGGAVPVSIAGSVPVTFPDGGTLAVTQGTSPWVTADTTLDALAVDAGAASSKALAVQGVVGGTPLPISGTVAVTIDGGITAAPPLVAALNAIADQTATATPTALAALAAGPNGILVRSSVDNDPTSRIRVATNAANGIGVSLAPGESFVFAVQNASDLLIYLQAVSDGGAAVVFAEQA